MKEKENMEIKKNVKKAKIGRKTANKRMKSEKEIARRCINMGSRSKNEK